MNFDIQPPPRPFFLGPAAAPTESDKNDFPCFRALTVDLVNGMPGVLGMVLTVDPGS